jgi:hypothetical protein
MDGSALDVWCQNLDQVKGILAADSRNLDTRDDQGWTPLHLACCSKKSRLWDLHQIKNRNWRSNALTDRPGARSNYSMLAYTSSMLASTPSNFAEKNVSFMIALELLQAGADVRSKAQRFCTPLHCAANSGWVDHVDALLYFGAPLFTYNECAPVCWATHPGTDCRMALEYLQKRLGPDSWRRIQKHGHCDGGKLPDYTKPSQKFIDWYMKDLTPNTSRPCLPGSSGAVMIESISSALLCSLCKAISIEELSSPSGYIHAESLHTLKELSKDCRSCRFLFHSLKTRRSTTARKDISQVILRTALSCNKISTLKLQLSGGCYCNESRSLDFESCKGHCDIMLMEDITFDAFSSDCRYYQSCMSQG